jgi:acyl carrier protein
MPSSDIPPDFAAFLLDTLQNDAYTPATLTADTLLFVGGLNLDSIDVIDLGLAMRARYGVELPVDVERAPSHTATVGSLLALVEAAGAR